MEHREQNERAGEEIRAAARAKAADIARHYGAFEVADAIMADAPVETLPNKTTLTGVERHVHKGQIIEVLVKHKWVETKVVAFTHTPGRISASGFVCEQGDRKYKFDKGFGTAWRYAVGWEKDTLAEPLDLKEC